MNESILQLVKDILVLTPPINPHLLQQIFKNYSLTDTDLSSDFKELYSLLTRLQKFSFDYCNYSKQLTDLESMITSNAILSEQIKTNHNHIIELQTKNKCLKNELLSLYQKLEHSANRLTLALDCAPNIGHNKSFADINAMISAMSAKLKDMTAEIDIRLAKASLVINNDKLATIRTDLNNLDSAIEHDQPLQELEERFYKLSTQQEFFQNMEKTALLLQKKFSEFLSNEHLPIRIEELKAERNELEQALRLIDEQLAENNLPDEMKNQLKQDFVSCSDKTALINSYRNKLDTFLTLFDPRPWIKWGMSFITQENSTTKHQEQQRIISLSIDFFELLTKKSELENTQRKIETSIAALSSEQNKSQNNSLSSHLARNNLENGHPDRAQLVSDALQLLSQIASADYTATLELNEHSSDIHILETLILNIPTISHALEKTSVTLTKLGALISVENEIYRLRDEFNLSYDKDSLLPDLQDAIKEQAAFAEYEALKTQYQELLLLCETYLGTANIYHQQTQQLMKLVESQNNLKLQISNPPKQRKIDSIAEYLVTLTDAMSVKLQQLAELSPSFFPPANTDEAEAVPACEPQLPQHASAEFLVQDVDGTIHTNHDSLMNCVQSRVYEGASSELNHSQATSPNQEVNDLYGSSANDEIDSRHDSGSSCFYSDEDETNSDSFTSSSYSSTESDDEESQSLSSHSPTSSPPNPLTDYQEASADEYYSNFFATNDESTEEAVDPDGSPYLSIKLTRDSPPIILAINQDQHDVIHSSPSPIPSANSISSASSNFPDEARTSSEDHTDTSQARNDNSASPKNELGVDIDEGFTPLDFNILFIAKCHKEIKYYLQTHPEHMQKWYDAVYLQVKKLFCDELYSYKAAHIVRDILFELEHQHSLDVLDAYIRLCPDPEQDIRPLLALKPSLLIRDDSYFDETDILYDSPEQLKRLYQHYDVLNKKHPVEAELFLQAIRSVHIMLLYSKQTDQKLSAQQIPLFTADPRYEPLKRHRGFFRLWELLEDLYNLIWGKIHNLPEYKYCNQPCFFKTKSHQLIEEADELLQNLLPLNTP
ncbi:hypothetical protein [Legionella worsleiensis]|uniref:Interaptin n=1 Tax=Legionella worsleiensis TaxID=45076 RepID=A0A0W1AEW5_9GAMM|nr:hypothetical protein [Legionella worsleiensis]KTD79884.1 interaptin [Legionella worsleiensis]STY32396.1 interaptin [Legionella worsleiensis]